MLFLVVLQEVLGTEGHAGNAEYDEWGRDIRDVRLYRH